MSKLRPIFLSYWLLVTLLLLWPAFVPAQTATYPTREDLAINDYANLLTPQDANEVRGILADLQTGYDIEATVLTIGSITDYGTGDSSIDSFATNLFNSWGIGSAERNDGVLILVAVEDREVRIELGMGYGTDYNDEMQQVIDEQMLPAFRANSYSRGILNGTRALARALTGGAFGEASIPSNIEPMNEGEPVTTPSDWWWSWIPALLGGLGLGGFTFISSRRKHTCSNCQNKMVLLSELEDDAFLSEGQKLEEQLKSVNHQVWQCPRCNMHTIQPKNSWFTSWQRCPSCQHRTMSSKRRTLVSPTTLSTGTAEVTSDCRHCQHHNVTTVTLPRLNQTSSSSSSGSSSRSSSSRSSSGGRSSGGGAKGKW